MRRPHQAAAIPLRRRRRTFTTGGLGFEDMSPTGVPVSPIMLSGSGRPGRNGPSRALAAGPFHTACALAMVISIQAVWPERAAAVVLAVQPQVAIGATNNPRGALGNQSAPAYEFFGRGAIAAGLTWTGAQTSHQLQYGIHVVRYAETEEANNVGHTALWASTLTLSPRTDLGLGAHASLFSFSAISNVNPAGMDANSTPLGASRGPILNGTATQMLTYQPTALARYHQTLSVGYLRPWDEASQLHRMLRTTLTLLGEWTRGLNTYSLAASAIDLVDLGGPTLLPSDPRRNRLLTMQLLGGWRRELSITSTIELRAGPVAAYGPDTGSLAVGPGAEATFSYRRLLWYATLTVAQRPTVNLYLGETLISDSATLRLDLPLNAWETLRISGLAGYTYAQRIGDDRFFLVGTRAYQLIMLGASLSYVPERWPITAALEYSSISQYGFQGAGFSYPSTERTIVILSLSGHLAWGEGNSGFARR